MKRKTTLVIELDAEELAFRIAQACLGMKAPPGTCARTALDAMDRIPQLEPGAPNMGAGFRAAAQSSLEYLREQMQKGQRPQ